MHIENVNINLGGGPIAAAFLASLLGSEGAERETPCAPSSAPRIGDAWPGIDGVYAGVSRGRDGEPDAPLILLNARPDRDMTWQEAVEWAKSLGDGARLPTRFESALLYANVQDQVDKDRVHWTGEPYSGADAWAQNFDDGYPYWDRHSGTLQARAVRRLNPSIL